MNAGEVAVAPEARQVHSFAALGFDQARQSVERPEVVVSVDGRNRVESGLQAAVGGRVARCLAEGRERSCKEEDDHPAGQAKRRRVLMMQVLLVPTSRRSSDRTSARRQDRPGYSTAGKMGVNEPGSSRARAASLLHLKKSASDFARSSSCRVTFASGRENWASQSG